MLVLGEHVSIERSCLCLPGLLPGEEVLVRRGLCLLGPFPEGGGWSRRNRKVATLWRASSEVSAMLKSVQESLGEVAAGRTLHADLNFQLLMVSCLISCWSCFKDPTSLRSAPALGWLNLIHGFSVTN